MELTNEEKLILLNAARKSIESLFTKETPPAPDYERHPVLKSKAGAFVTLTINSQLRGCIGYIIGAEPLYETVCSAAIQAARHDPRFYPLSKEELPAIQIEISVLSPPFKLSSYDDIELGKHGLILEEEGRRGLLLPQVPIEHNMNRDEFLSALCQKAGFPPHKWKEKSLSLSAFTTTIFSEKDLEGENEQR